MELDYSMVIRFPALFSSADEASNKKQKLYLRLIAAEYALLLVASIFALFNSADRSFHVANALVFVAGLAILLYRALAKPEQAWYKSRALAESIRTITWRYCMRAEPFDGRDKDARQLFRNQLAEILWANRQIGVAISGLDTAGDENTSEMEEVRNASLQDRRAYYLEARVRDQRTWYENKAKWNKRRATQWTGGAVVIYGAALILIIARIAEPVAGGAWPTGPLIVLAASCIGWIQIKKFNELASAYALTGHEIGLIQGHLQDADAEAEFSKFVNDAELAFSREHTQWVARQNT